jgi:assimilatory nitrate reductase catalytic subunit
MSDAASNDFRTLVFTGERLDAALFVSGKRDPVAFEWLIECLGKEALGAVDRKAALAGRPPGNFVDLGPLVCSCFAVRRETIAASVRDGARNVEAVGAALKAGTNCGSCRPEINRVISDVVRQEAAQVPVE